MNKYLKSTDKLSGDQKSFIEKLNSLIEKAWTRTDGSLTKVSAGFYYARIGDEIHEIYKHDNGIDWMTNELNENNSHVWEGTLADFRQWKNEQNQPTEAIEKKRVFIRIKDSVKAIYQKTQEPLAGEIAYYFVNPSHESWQGIAYIPKFKTTLPLAEFEFDEVECEFGGMTDA